MLAKLEAHPAKGACAELRSQLAQLQAFCEAWAQSKRRGDLERKEADNEASPVAEDAIDAETLQTRLRERMRQAMLDTMPIKAGA